MSDMTVDVLVTPNSDFTNFTWTYSMNGGSFQPGPLEIATLDHGDSLNITMNISAGGAAGEQCVFQDTPLQFFRPTDPPTPFIPLWYNPTIIDSSTISFMDTNTNSINQVYRFIINGTYIPGTDSGVLPQDVQSPDPTILNVGTDGNFEDDHHRRQEQPRAVATQG